MNHPTDANVRIELVGARDAVEAVASLLPRLAASDRRRIEAGLSEADQGRSLFWVAYRGERARGVVRVLVQPGRTAVATRPALVAEEETPLAQQLLERAVSHLATQHVQLVQALAERDRGPEAELWTAAGFQHAADLLYLMSPASAFPDAPPAASLTFTPYSPEHHQRLVRVVEQTYVDSLDCPALDAARQVDDVLAGYRAIGSFDPARWLMASDATGDVGCVLLADYPAGNEWELVYLGVVPEARGRGFGLAMTRHAEWLARCAGRERLVVAVDAANAPALDVYAKAGFIGWDRRSIFLRTL